MTTTDDVVALVLAAGRSSRMGAFKPLLPLKERSVVGHVVTALREGGIRDIRVVVGHRAEDVEAAVRPLAVRTVPNSDFARGMYSSVQAGVRSLTDRDCAGALVLPVDIPLVAPGTIAALCQAFTTKQPQLLYPVHGARRGHPPLIAASLFGEILADDGTDGLKAVLARHAGSAVFEPTVDDGIIRDMDRPEDYAALRALVGAGTVPSPWECVAILSALEARPALIAHARTVARLAGIIATKLNKAGAGLDVALIEAGALLHDCAKGVPDHAHAGALFLERMGFSAVAPLVATHTEYDFTETAVPDERAVVHLADKLVQGDVPVPIAARFDRTFRRLRDDAAGLAAAQRRYGMARRIAAAVSRYTGEDPEQLALCLDGEKKAR